MNADQLLQPLRFVQCQCGTTFSQPVGTRRRKFCDACRIAQVKAHGKKANAEKEAYSAVVVELGGPKIFNIINNAGSLGEGEAHTREETAKKFGISLERVRQIEMKAFAKLMLMGKMLIEETQK